MLPNGDIEVGVHIADVTYFLSHNSQLDKEAKMRGTTFYLVDRRYDMLHSLLSSGKIMIGGSFYVTMRLSAQLTLSAKLSKRSLLLTWEN